MGGQLNYFGFWLDDDFGSGHSRGQPSCTTYGSPQLSAKEEFKLDKLEAWGVGVPPENEVSQKWSVGLHSQWQKLTSQDYLDPCKEPQGS